jgi:error-prone DNA polymerase
VPNRIGTVPFCFEDCAKSGQSPAVLKQISSERSNSNAVAALARYRDVFRDRCYLLAELPLGPDDERRLDALARLARRARVPLAAAGDVHYHEPDRGYLQDVLTAIRTGTTIDATGPWLFANHERHLKTPAEMATLFATHPQAIHRALEVAGRCAFSLAELRYEYPDELCPAGTTPLEHLTHLAWQGAAERYPDGLPERVRRLMEHELALIGELGYEAYFLTVWDLVRFARSRDILCQGRGSAANSAVCYALGVTAVDPDRLDVLFERFISRERNEAPDIDVDFEHERREEVLQYLYEKYGRDRAAMTAEVITYRPRSAVRDVGQALGLPPERIDRLAKGMEHFATLDRLPDRLREAGLEADAQAIRRLAWLVRELLGFPRHLSQHVGGMVITRGPVWELAPVENAAMPGRTVIPWDKDDLDELGILKVDCLALGMLTAIHKCFDLVEGRGLRDEDRRSTLNAQPSTLTLASIPPEDPEVYAMLSRADTIGVFQIESRAQMSMLPRLRPRCFYDLVIEVAIVRPGPIQGDMVHPYLRRRTGEEPVEYPNEAIRAVLHKTLGVPLFQEQAMRLAVVAAGFSPGEADQLRRAMGAWRRPGVLDAFRQRLIDGMTARGLSAEYAARAFQQLQGFGEYGFPESHAASFALLVYVSAWLKRYHPAAFAAALLNSQPMGFYAPAQLVRDAREHGVEIRPMDVNHSAWDCTLEGPEPRVESRGPGSANTHDLLALDPQPSTLIPQPALRLGLRLIRGLPEAHARRIEQARGSAPFRSLADLARRAHLGRGTLVRLARADACGSLGLDRRGALWQALAASGREPDSMRSPKRSAADALQRNTKTDSARQRQLFSGDEPESQPPQLAPLAEQEQVLADYATAGLSLRAHPLAFHREHLDALGALRAEQLATWPAGRQVRVAGLVLVRQRPGTAGGITFVTLEDETGQANLIVRPRVWEQHRPASLEAVALLAHGQLQREGQVIHVLVNKLEDLAALVGPVRRGSRDFR